MRLTQFALLWLFFLPFCSLLNTKWICEANLSPYKLSNAYVYTKILKCIIPALYNNAVSKDSYSCTPDLVSTFIDPVH